MTPLTPPARPIVVIGSINTDLACRTLRLPRPGETVLGTDFVTVPGGKGANQAVAAARLGGTVHMIGRAGEDDFGRELVAGLAANGVRTGHVAVTPGVASGCAMIVVEAAGENSIVVVSGANARLTPADVDAAGGFIAAAAAVVLQLEVPLGTVRHALALCRRLGVYTILDPAPVPPDGLPADLYDVDLLTPNENEAAALLGEPKGAALDAERIARALLARGPKAVVLKRGAAGAFVCGPEGNFPVAPFPAKVVDTTAAGDAFTGALAVARAEGMSLNESVRLANAAGALCCQTRGARPALPTRAAVDALLSSRA